jgi:hypothetical protein
MLEGLKGHAHYRRQTLGIFAKDAPAATLPFLMNGSRPEKNKRTESEVGTARKKASPGSKQKVGPKDGTSRATPDSGQRKANSPRPDRRTAEGKSIYPYANGDYSIGRRASVSNPATTRAQHATPAHTSAWAPSPGREKPRQTPRDGRRNHA